jgi:hypothetical protein
MHSDRVSTRAYGCQSSLDRVRIGGATRLAQSSEVIYVNAELDHLFGSIAPSGRHVCADMVRDFGAKFVDDKFDLVQIFTLSHHSGRHFGARVTD